MLCPNKAASSVLLLVSMSWCAYAGEAAPAEEAREGRFLRLVRDKEGAPLALEAAIVHYVPSDRGRAGPMVDLISAVHVAEEGYYDELNRLFGEYDAVLYELVAPEGTRVPWGGREAAGNPVSFLQGGVGRPVEPGVPVEGNG